MGQFRGRVGRPERGLGLLVGGLVLSGCCSAGLGPAGSPVTRQMPLVDPVAAEQVLDNLDLCSLLDERTAAEVLGESIEHTLPGGEGPVRDCRLTGADGGMLEATVDVLTLTDVIDESSGEPVDGLGVRAWFLPQIGQVVIETTGPRIYVRAAPADRHKIAFDDLQPIAATVEAGVADAVRGVADAD